MWRSKAAVSAWRPLPTLNATFPPAPHYCRSSCEADEQSGAIRGGAGGAKDRDQGEREPAKHAPGAGPGKCVTGAGARTARRAAREEGEVHFAPAPCRSRDAENRVLRVET